MLNLNVDFLANRFYFYLIDFASFWDITSHTFSRIFLGAYLSDLEC